MDSIVSPSFLKQKARQLRKRAPLSQSQALNEAAKLFGFSNYQHYLNVLESRDKRKEADFKIISSEKDMFKKSDLAISFIKNFNPPFYKQLEIFKLFQQASGTDALQVLCEKLKEIRNSIESCVFNSFLTDEGKYEINFRSPNFIAKNISTGELTYEVNGEVLYVDGNYVLNTEFELDENDPISKDVRFKDHELNGWFGVEIDRNMKVNLVHSDMSIDNGITPMRGFTEGEIKSHCVRLPDEVNLYP